MLYNFVEEREAKLTISRKEGMEIMIFKLNEKESRLRDEITDNVKKIKSKMGQNGIKEEKKEYIQKMGNAAHELHMSLVEKGCTPQHKSYMIINRGVEPEDPLFYMHIHPAEDLLQYITDLESTFKLFSSSNSIFDDTLTLFGVITLLDVLGWKGIYSRKKNAIYSLATFIEKIREKSEEHRGKINDGTEVLSISDTIVIYTPCSEEEVSEAIDIHRALCQWIIPESIYEGIPVRGAISYGEVKVQKNIYVGKAVDEAASWYEQADWIGVHLTPSAEFIIDIKDDRAKWIKFSTKCKNQMDKELYCVNWTADWQDKKQEIKNIEKKFCKLGPITPEIVGKFKNTLKFIEEIK